MELHDIEYVKHFVGGLKDGLSIPQVMTRIDKTRCAETQAHLNGITPDNPGTEISGGEFWVTGVRCRVAGTSEFFGL